MNRRRAGRALGRGLALVLAAQVGGAGPAMADGEVMSKGPAAHPLPAEQALSQTLGSPRYRFCSDDGYPLSREETAWCPQLPLGPDVRAARCPRFRMACQGGATASKLPETKPLRLNLPEFGGLGRLLFWMLLAGGAAALIWALAHQALVRARRKEPTLDATPAPAVDGAAAAAAAEIERDVERLLARAHVAAAAGDFAAAVADLYAALLRRLEGDGHVRIHASATNGDYLRDLRTHAPALAPRVRAIASDVEATTFGTEEATDPLYRSLLERIMPLLPRAGSVLALVLALGATLAGCGPPPRPDWPGSPSGNAAVVQFLTAAGVPTTSRLAGLHALHDAPGGGPAQLVVLSHAEVTDGDWLALREWLGQDEKTLILATGPRPLPDWLAVETLAEGAKAPLRATALLRSPDDSTAAPGRPPGALLDGQVPGAGWVRPGSRTAETLIDRGPHPYAVLLPSPIGRVLVLADDHLLTNASLAVADNAALLLALLQPGDGAVELVGEDTGAVAATPMAAVARGQLAPFMAQLGACLVLLLLWQGRAFGRLVDRDVERRRMFAEHVQALGTQYTRARAAAQALASYGTWVVERLRERVSAGGSQAVSDLAGAVAARTGRPLGDVARILFAARKDAGATSARPPSWERDGAAQHDLLTMRDLHTLLAQASAAPRTGARPAPTTSPPTEHQPKGSPKP